LFNSQLVRGKPREPSVNRERTEVEHRGLISSPLELDIIFTQDLKAESQSGRGIRGQVAQCKVHTTEMRSHLHVGPLDVQPEGRLHRRRLFSMLAGEPAAQEQYALVAGYR